MKQLACILSLTSLCLLSCSKSELSASVLATAYNSVASQTEGNPKETAFGDILKPGMKAIAVSRDLEEKGLRHGTEVRIEGLEGSWVVQDRMHVRWKNKIDIYLGTDLKAAKEWGKREVQIYWQDDN